ncbi:uncharacterized protein SEPMUDRAFT_92347 [Sphaerulina musiva SO2202]|uniref:RBR-type E3 ubiquitin transferase n=1 Tax=Sphaerulina musiva (strain SO2202) TaxID=692275 RepID=N1QDL2_SPHMS|nr:uncharacterized protein SEPMUDRAFT_92347 [Sphaerulina musiva SO2202]EMF09551.1 hypothetical protein SEPMUDRAFT_92347 [Sphaerulina musiva SO2202]
MCCEEKVGGSFPSWTGRHAANHHDTSPGEVCFACWEIYLQMQIEATSTDKIKCAECNVLLAEADIRHLVGRTTYDKYTDKASLEFMKQDPLFRVCPSATCSYGYIHTTAADGNIFRCQLCQCRYCILCEVVMHEGETCGDYQLRVRKQPGAHKKHETASRKYLKAHSKKCPKCTIHIQKNHGCDHMTCNLCHHEFCWVCLATYNGPRGIHRRGNEAHRKGCHYLPANLPSIASEEAGMWDSDGGIE